MCHQCLSLLLKSFMRINLPEINCSTHLNCPHNVFLGLNHLYWFINWYMFCHASVYRCTPVWLCVTVCNLVCLSPGRATHWSVHQCVIHVYHVTVYDFHHVTNLAPYDCSCSAALSAQVSLTPCTHCDDITLCDDIALCDDLTLCEDIDVTLHDDVTLVPVNMDWFFCDQIFIICHKRPHSQTDEQCTEGKHDPP